MNRLGKLVYKLHSSIPKIKQTSYRKWLNQFKKYISKLYKTQSKPKFNLILGKKAFKNAAKKICN